jgi:hypothetical protein
MNDSTLRHDVFTTIYGIINGNLSSYTTVNGATPVLYGGYPDVKNISYPCIILEPIEVNEDSFTLDESRIVSNKSINIIIHIFSKVTADLDVLADGVINSIKTTSLTGSGVFFNNCSGDSNSFIQANEQKVKGKTLTVNLIRR